MTDGLFDLPDARRVLDPTDNLTPDQRRIRRQYAGLLRGQHPLGTTLATPIGLHPDAAPPDDPKAPGLRCKTCRFRIATGRWPKCTFGAEPLKPGPRMSRGAGTDVRAWWPACRDYQPKDGTE